jgi:hypothetical protein
VTDYTKSTNFATKDNLSSGNPLKIVKGTEIDTEFNNIATAIATKADLASPTFTGTPSLPTGTTAVTQSSTDSSTKVATTAFVQAVAQVLFPVGAIYSATVSTNPATLLGFGTWTAFGAGRVLIGAGTGGGATYTAGSTGGSKDAITVSHTHTATSTVTDNGHAHYVGNTGSGIGNAGGGQALRQNTTKDQPTTTEVTGISVSTSVSSTGSSGTDANLPPYVVVYMWQRTA